MNVFHKFTLQSLKKNKSRTLFTIIGIALSIALATAVIEGAYSGVGYMRNCEAAAGGSFHGAFSDLSDDELREVSGIQAVTDFAVMRSIGWADIGSHNPDKPYLWIKTYGGENFSQLAGVKLLSGRLPENDGELLLPAHLADNGGVKYKTGDRLTLQVGQRVSGETALGQATPYIYDEEELTGLQKRSYTVVGIYERFHPGIESYSCPGYTALTGGEAGGSADFIFTLKNPAKFYKMNWQTADRSLDSKLSVHSDLIRLYGGVRSDGLTRVIYGFAAVLIFLVSFGTISLIYNSFSISVSERTRQFGILKSVGADSGQLRKCVRFEALVLCGAAIPVGLIVGCLGIGITLYCLRDSFTALYFDGGGDVQMKLALSVPGLFIAALVGVATTLISARIPASRAIKISAIDSIRQTEDINLKGKAVKTSKLREKLFGFEGVMAAKNFKRNKKRYRAVVRSLFLSVTLFISASSFCAYLTEAVDIETAEDTGVDIIYNNYVEDPQYLLNILSSVEGVEENCFYTEYSPGFWFDKDLLTDDAMDYFGNAGSVSKDSKVKIYGSVFFLSDGAFDAICAEEGIDPSGYYDTDSPRALLCNNVLVINYSDGATTRWAFEGLKKDALPCTGQARQLPYLDGYYGPYEVREEAEGSVYVYYPSDYMNSLTGTQEPDPSMAKLFTEDEIEVRTDFTADRFITGDLFPFGDSSFALVYPYSMFESVIGGEKALELFDSSVVFCFNAKDHGRVTKDIKDILVDEGENSQYLYDNAADNQATRMIVKVVNVFSYGFIILISLIAMVNVFNTISTNISLRRREFAMLKSIGLSEAGFSKMMNYECVIYGIRGLAWGLPASVVMTYIIYRIVGNVLTGHFYLPWAGIVIAVGSVFAVVFATMLYATGKIRKDNLIDTLKNENI